MQASYCHTCWWIPSARNSLGYSQNHCINSSNLPLFPFGASASRGPVISISAPQFCGTFWDLYTAITTMHPGTLRQGIMLHNSHPDVAHCTPHATPSSLLPRPYTIVISMHLAFSREQWWPSNSGQRYLGRSGATFQAVALGVLCRGDPPAGVSRYMLQCSWGWFCMTASHSLEVPEHVSFEVLTFMF